MKIGIIGLSQSGKSTVFSAVCPHHQESHMGAARMEVLRGITKVPDDRIWGLEKIFEPQKVILAEIEFMDVAGVSGKKAESKHAEKEIPPALREPEVFAHVVRAFEDDLTIHPDGSVDPERDIENVEAELIFNDFISAEARLEKIGRQARLAGDENAKREAVLFEKVRAYLEEEKPLRDMKLNPDEEKIVRGFQFLSLKPKLVIVNIGEKDIPRMDEIADQYRDLLKGSHTDVVAMCAKIQAELAELEEDDRAAFMEDMGLSESARDKMIRKSFSLLGLITFFTGNDKEVHAWTVPRGTKAPQAAGAVHKDFEKGFIKAEVYSWDKLVEYGSESEAKKHGALRIEGKDYVVQDGDTIFFRFNI